LISCSKSNDEPNSKIKISPPAWIQGEWILDGGNGAFKFTVDDFCSGFSGAYSCNKESLNALIKAQAFAEVKENVSDTDYSIEMTFSNQTVIYRFKKVSLTKIQWVNPSISNATYTKK
jgi:hypothetical protein